MHLFTPDGARHDDGAALAPLARLVPGASAVAQALERFPRVTERAYAWVAEHRVFLGRLGIRTDRLPGAWR